jgi:ABC-type branched-subunit amino acid transport system ATPase component
MHRTIHKGIGRSFQITNIFPNLTVMENIRLACQAMGRDNFRAVRARIALSVQYKTGPGK